MEDLWRRPSLAGEIDVEAVIARVGRAQPLSRIPRRPLRVGGSRVVVVFDRADRLMPFWRDQIEVFIRVQREFGQDPEGYAWWPEGPPMWTSDAEAVAKIDPSLARGDAVVVLGDLGLHGSEHLRRRWRALGEALGRRGVLAAALLVCPAGRWIPEIVRPWRAIDWANPGGSALARTRHGDEAREQLLALLSWTVRLEPALVRAIRVQLGEREADVGTEAEVWNCVGVGRHPAGLMLSTVVRERGQERLRAIMQSDDQASKLRLREIIEIVRRHHAALPREIWTEEALTLELLDPGGPWITDAERRRVHEFTRRLRAQLDPGARAEASLGRSIDVRGWALRAVETRIPKLGWAHETLGAELYAIDSALRVEHEDIPIKPGQAASRVLDHDDAPVRRWTIRQVGESFRVGLDADEDSREGSLVGTLLARSLVVSGSIARRLAPEQTAKLPVPHDAASVEWTTSLQTLELRRVGKPEWAHAAGRDDYGLWAAFRVKGIEQRMRWISPGRFMMGSPESEVGRFDDEVLHEVTITEGFWLAETPCTQALWQAVMGTNPSRFESPRRPVENVSWNEVEGFLAKLADLGVELPSEEQWEYACRAGTTTATYAGDLDLRGANDAPVLHAIAWYGGNSGVDFDLDNGFDSSELRDKQFPHVRAGSREAGQKQRNPWGLYDMLGNVDEWCKDTYGNGPERVIRGGSWLDVAQYVRAAARYAFAPDDRNDYLGFRLARGQGTAPGKPAEKPARKQDKQGRKKQGRGTRPPFTRGEGR
ncbi:formylglycine-generating enzyme family protein [Nannocystaceae bacterium ST9]